MAKMKFGSGKLTVLTCALGLVVMTLAAPLSAQEKSTKAVFSFDVYGDSRSMMYLPYKQSEEAEARQLMVDMFELVLPAKVSAEVVDKHVKLTYDPSNNELVQLMMPFLTSSE